MSCWKCVFKLAIISETCALSQCVYFLVIACFLKIPRHRRYVFLGNFLIMVKAAKVCHFGALTVISGFMQGVGLIQVDCIFSPQTLLCFM